MVTIKKMKVVQTEIDLRTYNVLKAIAIHRGVPLKEIIRESLRDYAEAHKKDLVKNIYDDPIWKGIGLLHTGDPEASEKDTWGVVEWSSE
ncbi:hypothetical protein VFC49_08885 [Thermococcus sp. SY098]|uniref:hypothetical protein n=1 Tax=Thermococcus sp. SY098 TaxID=3111325 RepID=UPI002D768868|nr:hypothetical protein [Thermococcus sp. SY098]WRS52164.1 hypothetical protein VFC49_08885 [Thermococcus sp. SY098]